MEREAKSSPCIDCPEYQAALREIERLQALIGQHEIWQASLVQQLVDKDTARENPGVAYLTIDGETTPMHGEFRVTISNVAPEREA